MKKMCLYVCLQSEPIRIKIKGQAGQPGEPVMQIRQKKFTVDLIWNSVVLNGGTVPLVLVISIYQ